MHRITDHRVGGTSRKNFRLFRKLCGDKTLKNVIITTNMWNQVERHVGEAREYELRTDDILFKPVLEHGAQMRRHDGSRQSALAILQTIVLNHPMILLIQEELVTDKKDITQTAAGKELDHEAIELRKQQEKEIAELREQLDDAKVAADLQAQDELEKARQDVEEKVNSAERSRELLSQQYAEDRSRVEEEISKLMGELRMQAKALVVPNLPEGRQSRTHSPPREFVSHDNADPGAQNSVGKTPQTIQGLTPGSSNSSSQSVATSLLPDSRTVTASPKSPRTTKSHSPHTQGLDLVHPPSLRPRVKELLPLSPKLHLHLPLEPDATYPSGSRRQTDPPSLPQQRGGLSPSSVPNLSSLSSQFVDNRSFGVIDRHSSPQRRESDPQTSVHLNHTREDANGADERWLELVRKVLHEEIPKILSEGQPQRGNMFAVRNSASTCNRVDDSRGAHSSSQSRTYDTDLNGDLQDKQLFSVPTEPYNGQAASTGGWYNSEVPPPIIQEVLSLTRAEIRASVAPRLWEMQQEIEWLKREMIRARDERAVVRPGYELVGAVVDVLKAKGLLPRMTENSGSE